MVILYGLVSGKDSRSYYCDTNELSPLPHNAEKWECTKATGNLVPAGNRCELICKAGFVPTKCKLTCHDTLSLSAVNIALDSKRFQQVCKPNGWRNPHQVDVQCKKDGTFTLRHLK